MSDALYRLGHDLIEAAQGPLQFRVLMQVVVAIAFGSRDGVGDARRAQLPPYDDEALRRQAVVRDVWASSWKVLLVVLLMDVACQAIVLGFSALELGFAIALLVALPLYLATRGGVAWLALRGQRRTARRHI
jgi:hypothetical protein